jgi:hypothetical protein
VLCEWPIRPITLPSAERQKTPRGSPPADLSRIRALEDLDDRTYCLDFLVVPDPAVSRRGIPLGRGIPVRQHRELRCRAVCDLSLFFRS